MKDKPLLQFALVLVASAVVGGLVGGELTGSVFSPLGATVAFVVVFAGIMGLGALFTALHERKKKRLPPPEVRAVMDRIILAQGATHEGLERAKKAQDERELFARIDELQALSEAMIFRIRQWPEQHQKHGHSYLTALGSKDALGAVKALRYLPEPLKVELKEYTGRVQRLMAK
ncbi:hypothetical protein [Lysobacter humi (ex Lee et al. 2017)]